MKHKTKFSLGVFFRVTPEFASKHNYDVYKTNFDGTVTVEELFDEEHVDDWIAACTSSSTDEHFLYINNDIIHGDKDVEDILKIIHNPLFRYSWSVPREPLKICSSLTNHMYRNSPHETSNSCNNCNANNCDTCKRMFYVVNINTGDCEFETDNFTEAKDIFAKNMLTEEVVRAITEICGILGIDKKPFLNFDDATPVSQFNRLCYDYNVPGFVREYD